MEVAMPRITVERVRQSYERTKLRPIIGSFERYDHNSLLVAVCPIGSLCIEMGVEIGSIQLTTTEINNSHAYWLGFWYGVDEWKQKENEPYDLGLIEDYNNGYEDGHRVRVEYLLPEIERLRAPW